MRVSRAAAMVRPVQSPDILDIVPEHVADPVRRAPWRKRLLTGCGDGLLSLALNGAVVGWLMGVGWPLRDLKAPQAISVELVDHVPGAQAATPPKGASQSPGDGEAPSSVASAAPEHHEELPAKPDAPTPPKPTPTPTPSEPPKAEPDQKADTAPSAPMAAPSDTPPAAEPSGSAPPNPEPATPPPPEHPDNNAAPHLVEAPSAPPPEPVHSEPKPEPAAAPAPATEAKTASPATAEEPQALRPPDSPDAVPPPAPVEEAPKPLTAEQKRQAENTAKLAAMLPFGANIGADPLQSASTSQGGGTSTAYRGAVYANFNKAQDVIAVAKAKHLKGQAVIAFSIDDHGGIATIAVAVSSGSSAVDQAALELIKRAAPFPPPPPGAQRSFAPAIGLGLDE